MLALRTRGEFFVHLLFLGTAYVTQQLTKLREEKIKMETELYRRFLVLLNSKKRKIKELRLKLDPNAAPESPESKLTNFRLEYIN